MTTIFLSYARGDDEPFVQRLYDDLRAHGFDVWFDRVSMPSRQLTFFQEIRDAIAARVRLLLVIGPKATTSEYVTQEWRNALEMGKCVNPIVRLNGQRDGGGTVDGYALIPDELALIHAEDFRDDSRYAEHLANLSRQLSDPAPPLGKLVAVPTLPLHYLAQRDRLLNLRDALLVDLQRPVVVTGAAARVGVQGMGGIGKSVLAAALARDFEVRRAFPDGIFWIGVGQHPNLVELQRFIARELGDEALFNDLHAGKQKLKELLAERAALLILDDVWQSPDANAFYVLGPRCKLLLTTRDAGLVSTMAGASYQVQLPSEAEALALLANAARVPVDSLPPLASEIVAECGKLPLALALCGGMVQAGVTWRDLLDALREHELEFLADEHALEDQHRNLWRAMEVSVRVLPEDKQRRFAELAVFQSGFNVPEAAAVVLWGHTGGLSERHARRLLVEFRQRSIVQLDRSAGAVEPTIANFSLHDLLHDFATRLATQLFGNLAALHDQLLEAYRKQCPNGWHTGRNDGYFLRNLCHHLATARRLDKLYTLLLGSPDWMNAQYAASASCVSYIDDLVLATQTSPGLLTLVELRTAKEAAPSRVRHYHDDDLKMLVWLGREEEAVAMARSRAEPEEQCDSLIAVYEAKMSKESDLGLLETAVVSANRIQHDYRRATVLEKIATHLAEAGAIQKACELAELIERPLNRSNALKAGAVAMTQAGDKRASLAFTRALEAARQIEDPSEGAASQAYAMTGIAEELIRFKDDQATSILDEALEIADRIDATWKRFAVHKDIATAGAHLGASDRVLQVALRIREWRGSIDDDCLRPYSLKDIAGLLIGLQMLDLALELSRWVRDDTANAESRCSALLGIASAFAQAGREQQATSTFDQAIDAAHQIQDDLKRVGALVSVGLALHQAGDGRAADTLAKALATTHRLGEFERDSEMSSIAKALARVGDFDNAMEQADRIQDNWLRSEALQEIAKALATDGRLSRALALADRTDYGGFDASASEKRDLSLAAIASLLVSENKIDDALVVIDRIKRPRWQARPLAEIGVANAKIQDEGTTSMFTRALDALDRDTRATELAYDLREMAKRLVEAGDDRASLLFDRSRSLVAQVEDEREYSDALKQVVVALTQLGGFARSLEISQEVVCALQQAEALKEIAISLAQAGCFDHALAVANAIQDRISENVRTPNDESRAEALYGVALAMKSVGQTDSAVEVLDRAFVAATQITSSWHQASILEGIATEFAQAAECARASAAVFQIQHESRVPRALAKVAVELAKIRHKRSSEFLDQASKLAESIADPGERAEALKNMALVLANAGNTQASQVFGLAVESALKADKKERSYPTQLVGEALASAGYFDWALEIASQLERGWRRTPTLQALFRSLLLAEDQRAPALFEKLLEEARLIGTYMGARDGVLKSIIVDLIDANQRQRALEVFAEMSVDSMSSYRTEASNLIAKSLAQSGEFDEALEMLDLSSVSDLRDHITALIHHLASWAPAFEKIQSGLSLKILSEVTRIGGWTSPAWLRIHEILTRTATPKAPTSCSQPDETLDADPLDAFAVHQQKRGKSDAARQSAQERELQGVMEILGRQAITDRAPGHRAEKHLAIPMPHQAADPDKAARLNFEYQQSLAGWKALPWLKRFWTRKPEPPLGI